MRVNAYHSLGRISIYKASQSGSEESYLELLKTAIEFFEKAAKEPTWYNPSKFCFPFYRSFYTIISAKKQEAKDEVEKYLSEAKSKIGRSENKRLLFEAVENLSNALKEVQNLENMDLEAKKGELNFYRKYCEQAAELMKNTEEKAPSATIVMRKGLPILDRNLKSLLEEIQQKADTACQISKGQVKKVACAVKEEVQRWEISNQEEMTFYAKNLCRALKLIIPQIPENEFIHNEIDKALAERDLVNLFTITSTFIGSIPTLKMVSDKLNNLEKLVIEVNSKVDELIIISKPGISEEFVISSGIQLPGLSAEHVVTIPLQEISYSELKEDLERIKGKSIEKLSQLPTRLSEKVKNYLLKIGRKDVLEKLTN
ncbi:hypothetical protein MSMTP_1019 [Methanosarcina sp. MTP4]|nr:hypothetical protein MSMTP_1019 [Methanosarcina sp. MTP4]